MGSIIYLDAEERAGGGWPEDWDSYDTPLDVRPLAFVLDGIEPELWALERLPKETEEEEHGRRYAAADILDELLAEYANADELLAEVAA